jgi:tetratricopeptide (TPR) repeat protein
MLVRPVSTLLVPIAGLLALFLLGGCAAPAAPIEATSFLGEPLRRTALPAEFLREEQERLLAEACAAVEESPEEVSAWIWRGRRTAYLGRYREAVAIYTEAIARSPGEPRLLRHRGHRYITLRDLPRAIGDLELAASLIAGSADEVEPDGLPNVFGIPTSTLHTNVHYHLGLARYLAGDYAGARRAFLDGLEAATNPDMRCALGYWLVLSSWRLGPDGETEARLFLSTIDPEWTLLENEDYHALLCAFAQGRGMTAILERAREKGGTSFATVGYGVGEWIRRGGGTPDEAHAIWHEVIAGTNWAAFGHIAAEAALAEAERVTSASGR